MKTYTICHWKFTSIFFVIFLFSFFLNIYAEATTSPRIREIYIMGNEDIDAQTIMALMKYSHRGNPLDTEKLKQDLDSILESGYFDAATARIVSLKDGCNLYIEVKESAYKVKTMKVDGADAKYADHIEMRKGEIITQDKLKKEANKINYNLEQDGSFSQVQNISINKFGDIIFNIKKKTVDKIEFDGLETVKEWLAIKLIWPIVPGTEPSKEKIQKALVNLMESGYFNDVKAKTVADPEDNTKLTLIFIVTESKSGEWRLGGGHNSNSGWIATGGIKNTNIAGEGKEVSFYVKHNNIDTSYAASYRDNYFRQSDNALQATVWKSSFNGSIDGLPSHEQKAGVAITFEKVGQKDAKNFAAKIITGIRAETQTTVSPNQRTNEAVRAMSIALENNRTTESHGSFIRTGTYSFLRFDQAFKVLGGNTTFSKLSAEAKRYIPLSDKSLIALRAAAQISSRQTPKIEQISLGGDDGVRAIPDGDARGTSGTFLNLEYRRSLSKVVQAVIFMDAGRTKGESNSKAAVDAGMGLRIKSGMGLIRLDLAKAEGRAWQTIFGFGHSF